MFVPQILFVGFVYCIAGLTLTRANSEAPEKNQSQRVDEIFAPWNKADSPGCVCAVIQDGRIVYAKGYGQANLEHNEPITPQSVFYIASTSKQFTAACIGLLILDGKLSLEDDVRKFIPELHEFPPPVRIKNLIHHTSGIRDYFSLLTLADRMDSETITNESVVKLLARQRGLNFEPGKEHMYSNSNYVLLAEVVKRVSGKPMTQFAKEKIFDPLGMSASHFEDDARDVVLHRVDSYEPGKESGYRRFIKTIEAYGDGNLLTTVEDLAKWDQNFYSGQVGGHALIDLLLQKGTLTSGQQIDYAFGLFHDSYLGLPVIDHGGAFMGFRTEFMRFSQQKLSVIILCNLSSMMPSLLARQVAEIYLSADVKKPKPADKPAVHTGRTAVKIDPTVFDRYAGDFAMDADPNFVITYSRSGDRFFAQATNQPQFEILPTSDSEFFFKVLDAQVTFHPESDGKVEWLTHHQGRDFTMHRVKPFVVTKEELAAYPGRYYSDELDVSYDLTIENEHLTARTAEGKSVAAKPRTRDIFEISGGKAVFKRNAQGQVESIDYSANRLRNFIFVKQAVRNSSP